MAAAIVLANAATVTVAHAEAELSTASQLASQLEQLNRTGFPGGPDFWKDGGP